MILQNVQKSIRLAFLWTFLLCYTFTAFASIFDGSEPRPFYKNALTESSTSAGAQKKSPRPFWTKKKHIAPTIKRYFQPAIQTDYRSHTSLQYQRCDYCTLHEASTQAFLPRESRPRDPPVGPSL